MPEAGRSRAGKSHRLGHTYLATSSMPACEGPPLLPPPRSSTPALSSRGSSTRLLLERRSSPSIDSSPLHARGVHNGVMVPYQKLCKMRARVFKSKRRLHGYTSQHILDETLLTDKHITDPPPPPIHTHTNTAPTSIVARMDGEWWQGHPTVGITRTSPPDRTKTMPACAHMHACRTCACR